MSNTSHTEWSNDGTNACLQVVGQRQEFVIPTDPAIEAWVRGVLVSGTPAAPTTDMSVERRSARSSLQIWGIDFSGAQDAGRSIWIAKANPEGGSLRITSVAPMKKRSLQDALAELLDEIRRAGNSLIGLDFPFGLPRTLVLQPDWNAFLMAFGTEHASADAFRSAMYRRSQGRELRRKTDDDAKTPMSPYNLRLYRQTFYGIRDVLAPLAASSGVRVLPMQHLADGRPALIEICPRSTLKAHGLAAPSRADVLKWLAEQGVVLGEKDKATVLNDGRGDAQDSVIAAFATWRASASGETASMLDFNVVEGHVFVGRPASPAVARPRPAGREARVSRLAPTLLAAASLTLFVASAIHFGLSVSFRTLTPSDPFEAAALPEAVIGAVLVVGALAAITSWRHARSLSLMATLLAIVGVVVGLNFTLRRGEIGDIAYHVGLLGLLGTAVALLAGGYKRRVLE